MHPHLSMQPIVLRRNECQPFPPIDIRRRNLILPLPGPHGRISNVGDPSPLRRCHGLEDCLGLELVPSPRPIEFPVHDDPERLGVLRHPQGTEWAVIPIVNCNYPAPVIRNLVGYQHMHGWLKLREDLPLKHIP